jgi:hypothetical protein
MPCGSAANIGTNTIRKINCFITANLHAIRQSAYLNVNATNGV